jgi:hypothetical protein
MDRLVAIVTAAVSVGVFNGVVMLKTIWEVNARKLRGPWLPFGFSGFGLFASGLFNASVGLGVFLGLPLLPLEALHLLPLRGTDLQWFFAVYLVSLAAGKLARYGFWKWRLREFAA